MMSREEHVANRTLTEVCDMCGRRPATRQFENGRATDVFACDDHRNKPADRVARKDKRS